MNYEVSSLGAKIRPCAWSYTLGTFPLWLVVKGTAPVLYKLVFSLSFWLVVKGTVPVLYKLVLSLWVGDSFPGLG